MQLDDEYVACACSFYTRSCSGTTGRPVGTQQSAAEVKGSAGEWEHVQLSAPVSPGSLGPCLILSCWSQADSFRGLEESNSASLKSPLLPDGTHLKKQYIHLDLVARFCSSRHRLSV